MINKLKSTGTFILLFLASTGAHAAETAAKEGGDSLAALAAGFGIALAAIGGALGQGKVAATALEAIGRNPSAAGKLFVPMIIGLALIESLVIYAFLVTFVKL